MKKNLFEAFEKISDQEWKDKIIADLKGKSIEDLNWQLNDDFVLKPYYTESDVKQIDFPILRTHNPEFQIAEYIEVNNVKEANKMALDALMKGATAIEFHFFSFPSEKDFEQLFDAIGVEYIATHFSFATDGFDYLAFYTLWQKLLAKRSLSSTFACFDFDALLLKDTAQMSNMAKIVESNEDFASETIHIDCRRFHTNVYHIDVELKNCISKAKEYLEYFKNKNIALEKVAQQMYFSVNISTSYLLEVAKLRALKLLWVNLLESYGVQAQLPFLKVHFSPDAYTDSADDNLINATSLSMSALLGGANFVAVKPIDSSEKARRLARNILLVLQHEAGFNQVSDPMAGSYYVEAITDMLCKRVS